MRFQLSHTHAYPGCRVRIAEEDNEDENLVEFSDGVIVACRHGQEGTAIVLTIAAYRTGRGTEIDEKTWILLPEATKGDWKIKARVPQDAVVGSAGTISLKKNSSLCEGWNALRNASLAAARQARASLFSIQRR